MPGWVAQGLARAPASHLIPQMEVTGKVQLEGSSCEKKGREDVEVLGLERMGERNSDQ